MKVLITVKAYPAISTKYGETVCTAGITEEGKWIRIYPIPYRMLDYSKQFRKYDWIEIDLIRNHKDPRPESYRPVDYSRITTISHIKADGGPWYNRRKIVLKKVYHNLQQLIEEAKGPEITSLAIYKPKKILNFIYEPIDKDWTPAQLDSLKSLKAQSSLFENQNDDEKDISNFETVNKLPYKFSFIFQDNDNKEHKLMIEDWETGALYWNSLMKRNGDEIKACESVKAKYFYDFALTKDYYFILGTTKKWHFTGRNPFVIIGDFRPQYIIQDQLF